MKGSNLNTRNTDVFSFLKVSQHLKLSPNLIIKLSERFNVDNIRFTEIIELYKEGGES